MKRFIWILFWIGFLFQPINVSGQRGYLGDQREMTRGEAIDSLAAKPDTSAIRALLDSLEAHAGSFQALLDSLRAKPDTSEVRALLDSLQAHAESLQALLDSLGAKPDTSAISALNDSLALKLPILLPLPSADSTATGWKVMLTAGENLAFGDFCYEDTAGKYRKADCDTSATMPAVAVALETILADSSGLFLIIGNIRASGWGTLTKGKPVYPDTAAGKFTQTIPAGSGDIVQTPGHAKTINTIWFEPGDRTILKRK